VTDFNKSNRYSGVKKLDERMNERAANSGRSLPPAPGYR